MHTKIWHLFTKYLVAFIFCSPENIEVIGGKIKSSNETMGYELNQTSSTQGDFIQQYSNLTITIDSKGQ